MPRAQKSQLEVLVETVMKMSKADAAQALTILNVVNRGRAETRGTGPASPMAPAVPTAHTKPGRRKRAARPGIDTPQELPQDDSVAEPADDVANG